MTPLVINWNVPPDPQEIEQLRDAARLSWPEKLQWLEEMQRIALWMQSHAINPNQPNNSDND